MHWKTLPPRDSRIFLSVSKACRKDSAAIVTTLSAEKVDGRSGELCVWEVV